MAPARNCCAVDSAPTCGFQPSDWVSEAEAINILFYLLSTKTNDGGRLECRYRNKVVE